MKRLPKKLKFKVSYDIELDTSEILEKVRWASAPKINSNTDFSESWLAENWKEIIKWLEFIYNKWDGNYDPYPHKRLKNDDGSPIMMKPMRDKIWSDRRDFKKNHRKYYLSDLIQRRFLFACLTIEQQNKEKKGLDKFI